MNCATHNEVAAVAFCRTCGKPLCQNCTRDVRGVIYCESCLAARIDSPAPAAGFAPLAQTPYTPVGVPAYAPPPPVGGPNPAVAGILSGFFPIGVGAVYTGQYAKGLAHLVIAVLLIVAQSADIPDYLHVVLGFAMAFFYVYQIVDSVRSAHAIQRGEPAPDPFGLAQTFGTGEKFEGAKVPMGAAILIGLGVLFLLHTAGLFEIGMGTFIALVLIFLGAWLFAKNWGLLGVSPATICQCQHCRTRRLMGPAILLTFGVLLLLDTTSRVGFGKTWPAILLVVGIVKLMQSNASHTGHFGPLPPGTSIPPSQPPPPPAPPVTETPSEPSSSGEVNHV